MSVQAITWAYRQRVGTPFAKFLLVTLANYADGDGVCRPGVAKLQEQLEASDSTIRRSVQHLRKIGLLATEERRRKNGSQSSNEYHLNMAQTVTETVSQTVTKTVSPEHEQTVTQTPLDPSVEPDTVLASLVAPDPNSDPALVGSDDLPPDGNFCSGCGVAFGGRHRGGCRESGTCPRPTFDAVIEGLVGIGLQRPATAIEWGRWHKAAKEIGLALHGDVIDPPSGTSPADFDLPRLVQMEVARRAVNYKANNGPKIRLTPLALAGQWGRSNVREDSSKPSPGQASAERAFRHQEEENERERSGRAGGFSGGRTAHGIPGAESPDPDGMADGSALPADETGSEVVADPEHLSSTDSRSSFFRETAGAIVGHADPARLARAREAIESFTRGSGYGSGRMANPALEVAAFHGGDR